MAIDSKTWVVEITMPSEKLVLFQSILQGEDGLAVVRCLDPEGIKQQLWLSPSRKDELLEFLASLPENLGIVVLAEWTCTSDRT